MKKIFTLVLALILTLFLITACEISFGEIGESKSGGDNDNSSAKSGNTDENSTGGDNSAGTNDNAASPPSSDGSVGELKGDLSITMKTTDSTLKDWESIQVSMRTAEGYYYSISGEGGFKQLYVKDGNNYQVYMDWGQGEGYINYGTPTSKEQIEDVIFYNSTYKKVEKLYGSVWKKDGTETVAGRICDKYTITIAAEGKTGTMSYCYDQKTGIQLKSSAETSEGKLVTECTEFKTSGVVLPKLDISGGNNNNGENNNTTMSEPETQPPSPIEPQLPATAQPPQNQESASFTLNKTKYSPEETIFITVSGITQDIIENGFIGLFPAGARNDEYWNSVSFWETGSYVVEIDAPEEDGNYELRFFKSENGAVIQTISFTVG